MVSIRTIGAVILFSALLVGALVFFFESNNSSDLELRENTDIEFDGPFTPKEQRISNANVVNPMNAQAQITTNHGTITIELYEEQMPITTGNFIELARSGFYDGTKFHRVIEGFMIQGGDPNTKGSDESIYGQGGPEDTIQDEFVEGEHLTNTRGTIAMANTGQPNSGGSQFFINLTDNTGLDYDKEPLSSKHPVFGRVIDGMDVVDSIARVQTKERDIPVESVIVESIEINDGSSE